MHTRLMMGRAREARTQLEARHCARSASLFREALSALSSSNSALWMASVMISFTDSFCLDEQDPDNILSTTWLRVHLGVRTIFNMLPASSPFKFNDGQSIGGRCLGMPPPIAGSGNVPESLARLYDIDENSSSETNVYHDAVHMLSQLLSERIKCPLRFLAFVNILSSDFLVLLDKKDPKALLLLMRWYQLVPPSAWWLQTRSIITSNAIAAHLAKEGMLGSSFSEGLWQVT